MSSQSKCCKICGVTKEFSYFTKNTGVGDGYRNECKICYNYKRKMKTNLKSNDEFDAIVIDLKFNMLKIQNLEALESFNNYYKDFYDEIKKSFRRVKKTENNVNVAHQNNEILLIENPHIYGCQQTKQILKKAGVKSYGEQEISMYLKELFEKYEFKKVRPDWLKNPRTGKNLELDFYCEELKIAIEYQGKQHSNFVKFYHSTDEDFVDQLQRDEDKEYICYMNYGIRIFYIHEGENIYEKMKKIRGSIILDENDEKKIEREIT